MMSLPPFTDQTRQDRAVISIAGDGAIAWLNNLLTCDVAQLSSGSAAYGALLSPQGKILHDVFVYHAADRVLIDCAASQADGLVQKLVLYRLRAKLVIARDPSLSVGVHLSRPVTPLAYIDPRLADMGWRNFVPVHKPNMETSSEDYDQRRIVLGLADSVVDIGSDKVFPHEANFDQFGGVDFKKGCYVGQEVVSRMQHRGTARNRFLPITFSSGQERGNVISSAGNVVGTIHSVSGPHALGLVRIDRLAEAKGPLIAGSTVVRVRMPKWIRYDVAVAEVAQ